MEYIGRNCWSIVNDYLKPLPKLEYIDELERNTLPLLNALKHSSEYQWKDGKIRKFDKIWVFMGVSFI